MLQRDDIINREAVLRMAREAGFSISDDGRSAEQVKRMMTHFGQLIAAAEREACAEVCEDIEIEGSMSYGSICADIIRERGNK